MYLITKYKNITHSEWSTISEITTSQYGIERESAGAAQILINKNRMESSRISLVRTGPKKDESHR